VLKSKMRYRREFNVPPAVLLLTLKPALSQVRQGVLFFMRRVDKKDANEILKNQQDLKLYIGFMIS